MGGLLLSLAAAAGAGAAPGRLQQVLILESYGRGFAPWNAITPAFKNELARQFSGPVAFHETALETARADNPQAEKAFTEYLRALYAPRQPDLVVLIGGPAAQFWWSHRAALFPATPVVIGGMEPRQLRALSLTSNEVAVAIQLDLPALIQIILQVAPATTNLAIVLGNSPFEQFWAAQARREWQPFTNRLAFTWLNELPFPEMCRRVAALPPRSAVGFGSVVVDVAGVPYDQMEALDRLCAAAHAPVFGLYEAELGHGIIGGRLFSEAAVGRATGQIAARILQGEKPGSILPPIVGVGPPMFDWRELQQWHIDESCLPPGSVVLFRQPSLWGRYWWYALAALGIMVGQAVTIAALLAQRAKRRHAEAGLRESQQFMELATAAGELGLWVGDTAGGECRVNPRLRTLFGLGRDETVYWEDIFGRIHPDDRAQAESALQRVARQGGAFEFEGRLQLRDGGEKWVAVKGLAAAEARGRPLRTEGVVFDLTARREAELATERHRDELRHIGRVHVLGQLSSALAHELNQPLGAILSNTEAAELLLQGRTGPWDEVRAILADIRKDDQRASDVIHRMRTLLRRHELEVLPLPAGELVEDCIALTRPDAVERHVLVESVILPGMPQVHGDRVHLEQVLLNLLVNGMDAVRDFPVGRRRLMVRVERGGDHTVAFSVADAGAGIPPDQLDHIFEPFYTTKPNGLGLGLSISRTIIEAHHGRIWAENNSNGGATFRFVLPAADGEKALP